MENRQSSEDLMTSQLYPCAISRRLHPRKPLYVLLLVAFAVGVAGCSAHAPGGTKIPTPGEGPATGGLAGTSWRLVEVRSNDDKTGVQRPDDPAKYTMTLEDGGRVSMQLNCNRASGSWSATAADADGGTFRFGPLAATRALCPPPSLDERIARDADFVRSYLHRDGRLYLNLMADGGTYVWEPSPSPK